MTAEDFNGYDFDNPKTRKKMKYLIVDEGDLDINNAYAFLSKATLRKHLKESHRNLIAIFKIEDISKEEGLL